MNRERVLFWGAVALLLLGGWWLRSPLHSLPFERDEGAYVVVAQRWAAGAALYRDVFDHKPPLLFLVYRLALGLPGGLVVAVRVLATVCLLATGLALVGLALRLQGRAAALAALALLLVYSSSPRLQGPMFNSEAALVLPATLGCLLAVWAVQAGRLRGYVLAGLAVGVAAGIKPVGLALLGPLALAPLLAPGLSARQRGLGLGLGLLGTLAAPLCCGLLLWHQGALRAAYEALVVYNRLYTTESLRAWSIGAVAAVTAPLGWLALAALVGWVVALGRCRPAQPQQRRAAWAGALVAGLWALALLAGALLSLRAYPHYYQAAVPLMSLWAGVGLALLARAGAPLLAVPLGLALLAGPLNDTLSLWAMPPAQQIAALYGLDGDQFFAPAARIGALIAKHVPLGRPVFVWAAEPQLYVMSGRRPATRFIYDYPLDRLPGARDEALAALARDPPALIVTYRGVRPIGFHPFMDEHGYRLLETTYGYDLFVRDP